MNSEHDAIDWLWLDAYFAGTLGPAERAAVDRWLASAADAAAYRVALREAWEERHRPARLQADHAAAKQRILDMVRQPQEAAMSARPSVAAAAAPYSSSRPMRAMSHRIWNRRMWYAGIGAAMVLLAFVVRSHLANRNGIAEQTYATAVGERVTVTLADGSRVTLAPQTSLTVAANFGAQHRTVSVQGQAFFDIQQQSGAPFVVRTGAIQTRVLGTTFDVTRYVDDGDVQVIVTSGKVALEMLHHAPVTLTAGMLARATDSSATVSAMDKMTSYTAWKDGTLEFRRVPVPEVLRTLSRWYGVQFRLADSTLMRERVTTYLRSDDTGNLLMALETSLNVTVTTAVTDSGQVLILRPRRHADRPVRRERGDEFSPNMEMGR